MPATRSTECLIFALFALAVTMGCAPSIRSSQSLNPDSVDKRTSSETDSTLPLISELISRIESYVGVPYRAGGTKRSGMDCSGFVRAVYWEAARIVLPRDTDGMKKQGQLILIRNLRVGDLIFFRTGAFRTIDHVGIYIGDKRFAHASPQKGITYASLESDYFRTRAAFGRRIVRWQ